MHQCMQVRIAAEALLVSESPPLGFIVDVCEYLGENPLVFQGTPSIFAVHASFLHARGVYLLVFLNHGLLTKLSHYNLRNGFPK